MSSGHFLAHATGQACLWLPDASNGCLLPVLVYVDLGFPLPSSMGKMKTRTGPAHRDLAHTWDSRHRAEVQFRAEHMPKQGWLTYVANKPAICLFM